MLSIKLNFRQQKEMDLSEVNVLCYKILVSTLHTALLVLVSISVLNLTIIHFTGHTNNNCLNSSQNNKKWFVLPEEQVVVCGF